MIKNKNLRRLIAWCPKKSLKQPNQSITLPTSNNRVALALFCFCLLATSGVSVYLYTLPSFTMEPVESEVKGSYWGEPWLFAPEHETQTVTIILTSKYGFNSPVNISVGLIKSTNGSEDTIYQELQDLPKSLSVTFDPNPVFVPANGEIELNFNITVNVAAQHPYGPSWSLKIKGESEKTQVNMVLRLSAKSVI